MPFASSSPLLKSRCWRLVSDQLWNGLGEGESAQEVPEIVGDDPQEQPHLIGSEAVAGEARPMGRGFALFDPLFRRPALIVANGRPRGEA